MSVTYQPKKKKRSTTHGFLTRTKKVIQRRIRKGRKKLSV